MRVDDLRFLFEVEGRLVVLEVRLWCFVGVVLFIVREQLGVWVPDKAISTASLANSVTDRENHIYQF